MAKEKLKYKQKYIQRSMWLEIEVLLKDRTINWQELGFDIQHDFARRMIRLDEIYYLQELLPDIQILTFQDQSSIYIRGDYESLRDKILHLQNDMDEDDC
jgi:hypothetical protein